ncbi:trypsin-like peptidase domain-containing protein [Candidatus Woesearchaeota archaeon]|nr:trypsin-like peptidase domain-containing protein [Candidatus Woesearchaeota archaeon]
MEDDTKKWLIFLFVLQIILIGYLGYFSKYSYDKFNNFQSSFNEFKSNTEKSFENVGEKIGGVEEEFKKSATQFTTSIQKLEVESEKLGKGLKDIQITTKDFSSIIEETLESVVSIQTNLGLGSGAIITNEGYIVTNHHVIDGVTAAAIITYKQGTFPVRLVKKDSRLDLALLKIEGNFRPMDFANVKLVKVGEKVIALGNPSGLSFSVTEGIISQVNRELNGVSYPLFQTDVPINPGNSGGPLANIQGQIVGINRLKIKGFEGLGFAIPADIVKNFVTPAIKEDRELLEKLEQEK